MINLKFYEDKDKKISGFQYYTCEIDSSDSDSAFMLDRWYRGKDYEEAKAKALENLKVLRDELNELIEREEKRNED